MRKGKGKEARLSFMGHALMENGNGLLMDFVVSRATGTAEREAVPVMLDDARQRPTQTASSRPLGPQVRLQSSENAVTAHSTNYVEIN